MYFHFILYLFQVHPFLVVKNSALDFVSLVICEKRKEPMQTHAGELKFSFFSWLLGAVCNL